MRRSPERDLDRHLPKHIIDDGERAATKAAVLGHSETLALYDRDSGEAAERYTTKTARAQEQAALADAAVIAHRRHRALPPAAIGAAVASRSLRPDQRQAFDHAVDAGGLKIIEGRAGTGKSYSLAAIRDAHEQAGGVWSGTDERRGAGPESRRLQPGRRRRCTRSCSG